MKHEKLFSIEWECSYNYPDYCVSRIGQTRVNNLGSYNRKRLASMLEFLAKAVRNQTTPFEVRDRSYMGKSEEKGVSHV